MNRSKYKPLSDSALMKLTKKQLIEQLRLAEHEYFIAEGALRLRGQVYDMGFNDGYFQGQRDLRNYLEQASEE